MTAVLQAPPQVPGTRPARTLRRRIGALRPGTYLVMIIVVVLTIYPMIWMLLGSFKTLGEFYTDIWGLPHIWHWDNFAQAFGVTAVPVLTTEVSLGLFDTRIGLILVYAAQNLPFGIFLMYSFFQSVPSELEEAALIDGCNRFKAFVRIVLPLAKPGLATLLIFTGTSVWNEYLMASVLIHQPNLETLPLGLVNFTTAHSTNYPELFAALSIVTAPVVLLYLAAQRQFISGLTAGALKG